MREVGGGGGLGGATRSMSVALARSTRSMCGATRCMSVALARVMTIERGDRTGGDAVEAAR